MQGACDAVLTDTVVATCAGIGISELRAPCRLGKALIGAEPLRPVHGSVGPVCGAATCLPVRYIRCRLHLHLQE